MTVRWSHTMKMLGLWIITAVFLGGGGIMNSNRCFWSLTLSAQKWKARSPTPNLISYAKQVQTDMKLNKNNTVNIKQVAYWQWHALVIRPCADGADIEVALSYRSTVYMKTADRFSIIFLLRAFFFSFQN